MADPYGLFPSSTADPEEISTVLNQFVQNSASSSSCTQLRNSYIQLLSSPAPDSLLEVTDSASEVVIPAEDWYRIGGSASRAEMGPRMRDESSDFNFSDPESYFGANVKDSAEKAFSSLGDLSCESEKAPEPSEVPSNPERPRPSSKRSRAAEVHNLSEKRRRSRINEKMKALQKLIPNSNKTDKASMLDEAIEYLKQLQLQVQMLSMRNGLSLYSMCLPGILQPVQLSPTGLGYEEENGFVCTNEGAVGIFCASTSARNVSNQSTISNQPIVAPPIANIANLESSFDFEASAYAHHGSFSHSTSSKEICFKEGPAQLQLETNHIRNNPSSSVS